MAQAIRARETMMIPLMIGGVFLAGYVLLIKLTEPSSPRRWQDERECDKFYREREKWLVTYFWNQPR
jgi:hypothetical protein